MVIALHITGPYGPTDEQCLHYHLSRLVNSVVVKEYGITFTNDELSIIPLPNIYIISSIYVIISSMISLRVRAYINA